MKRCWLREVACERSVQEIVSVDARIKRVLGVWRLCVSHGTFVYEHKVCTKQLYTKDNGDRPGIRK